MGAFFTNVQIRSGALEAVLSALRADADERGMDEVGSEAAESDRTVVVLPPLDGWITVYDEATESQDMDALDALARLTTRAAGACGFSALVHDSDVLELRLYDAGAPIDRVNTAPDYFARRKLSKKAREAARGKPELWAALGAEAAKVAEIFASENLFAERTLASLAELVGIEPSRVSWSFRYFQPELAPEGTRTLRFRSRARPSWETENDGPPGLEEQSMNDRPITLAVPDELRVGLTARSTGAASRGLEVRVWGSALDRGIVAIDRFEVVLGDALKNRGFVVVEAESTKSLDGEPIRFARSNDLALPSGSATPPAFAPGVDVMKMMEAMRRSSVHVNVVGRCIAPGDGELGIALIPLANPSEHAATITMLEISAPIARPLRFDPRLVSQSGGSSHLLAPLVGDARFIAMITSDRSRRELVDLVRAMIEDARFVIGTGDVSTSIFRADGKKPGTGQGKTSTMLGGKRLETLLESMATEQLVSLVVMDGKTFDTEAIQRDGGLGRFGISLGTGVLPQREELRVPTISAWLDARHEGAAAVIERWASRFDTEMRSGRGIQATLTRGSWQPQGDHTAYETATGISNTVVTLREWATRWLRVPGSDRTWLSAQLAARLTNRSALEPIADVESIGEALRIRLRDRSSYGELERALADILPTGTESHAVMRAYHAQ